jgi:hypothetical protein
VSGALVIRGERYLTLARVAELYEVRVEWVREVCAFGLLEPVEHVADDLAIAARLLDRVATIHRLNVGQGVELAAVAVLLDLPESTP